MTFEVCPFRILFTPHILIFLWRDHFGPTIRPGGSERDLLLRDGPSRRKPKWPDHFFRWAFIRTMERLYVVPSWKDDTFVALRVAQRALNEWHVWPCIKHTHTHATPTQQQDCKKRSICGNKLVGVGVNIIKLPLWLWRLRLWFHDPDFGGTQDSGM